MLTFKDLRAVNTTERDARMIFGFNTDVQQGETLYHVQSEARNAGFVLQTQVFVQGRCIGKHSTSFAEKVTEPDFSEDAMHEMLKMQHRSVIDAIREGKIEILLEAAHHS